VPNVGEPIYSGFSEKRRRIKRRLEQEVDPSTLGALALVQSVKSQQEHLLIYPKSLVLRRQQSMHPPKKRGIRQKIDHLSKRAQRGLRHAAVNSWPALVSQFVATYHLDWPQDGRVIKQHLNAFLVELRRRRPDLRYLWVLEFQDRGAPHFHIYLSTPPEPELHEFLASTWVRITDKGNAKALAVHRHRKQFAAWDMGSGTYVAKYLEKQGQKIVPEGFENVGRFYGASRGIVPVPACVRPEDFEHAAADRTTGELSVTWSQCVRWLGRWHQAQLNGYARQKGFKPWSSRFRTTPASSRLWGAAAAYLCIENYATNHGRKRHDRTLP